MKKNYLIIAGAIVAAVAIALVLKHQQPLGTMEPTPSASASPGTSKGYNNKYMSLDVAAGWKISETGTTGAVNVTKDNWVLFISPAATQASGVIGGRFDEFAGGAPGVETVMGALPQPRNGYECGSASIKQGVATIEGTSVVRHDFYTAPGALAGCRVPSDAPAAWFLSIIGNRAGFNEVSSVTDKKVLASPSGPRQFVITMSAKAATPDALPRQYTRELEDGLRAMDAMVSTLVFH